MIPRLSIHGAVARRFLVLRHFLAPPRALPPDPASVMRVVDRIGSIQFDPLEVAGRNHDLVLLARVAGYVRAWTDRLLYERRDLFEAYNKGLSLLPTTELPWYRLTWDRARAEHDGGAFDEHAPLVEELLAMIRERGQLSSTDVEPRAAIDWYWRPTNQVRAILEALAEAGILGLARRDGGAFDEHAPLVEELLAMIRERGQLSSTDVEPRAAIDWYWRPTNQVRAILEALAEAGILGLARRDGNRRVYDLAERLFPAALLAERREERDQLRHRLMSRHRAHGLLGTGGQSELWYGTGRTAAERAALRAELVEAGAIVPATVEGVRGERFLVASELPILEQAEQEVAASASPGGMAPGAAFLAPLDPFVWDRDLLRSLFGFDYVWEVYVPARKRRWGYYVLPILYGDRLVGRIEPRIDRAANAIRVLGLWWEPGIDPLADPGLAPAVAGALEAHRRFGEVGRVVLPRAHRHRAFGSALRTAGLPSTTVRPITRAAVRKG